MSPDSKERTDTWSPPWNSDSLVLWVLNRAKDRLSYKNIFLIFLYIIYINVIRMLYSAKQSNGRGLCKK